MCVLILSLLGLVIAAAAAPLPARAQVGSYGAEETVMVEVFGIPADEASRRAIVDRLKELTGSKKTAVKVKTSKRLLTVTLAPVKDPMAYAKKIDFGTVTGVEERVISVAVKKSDIPGTDSDVVSKALFDLKSSLASTRRIALDRLAKAEPVKERQADVIKAVEPLLKDKEPLTQRAAIRVLASWGNADSLPELLGVLDSKDVLTRRTAIEALARSKDAHAAEALAKRLADEGDREEASKALQTQGHVAEKAVVEQLKHTDPFVRQEACRILKVIGTPSSASALEAASKDTNAFVRQEASEALQVLKTRK